MNKSSKNRFVTVALLGALLMPTVVHADVYMHNPPGSNDRNRDRSDKEPNVVESIVNWVRGLF